MAKVLFFKSFTRVQKVFPKFCGFSLLVVDGVQAKEDRAPSNAQLIPILVVTIVVAMVVVLVVVLVAILSRRASARRKSAALLSSHNHSFATSSR